MKTPLHWPFEGPNFNVFFKTSIIFILQLFKYVLQTSEEALTAQLEVFLKDNY